MRQAKLSNVASTHQVCATPIRQCCRNTGHMWPAKAKLCLSHLHSKSVAGMRFCTMRMLDFTSRPDKVQWDKSRLYSKAGLVNMQCSSHGEGL